MSKDINIMIDKMEQPIRELYRIIELMLADDFSESASQREALYESQEELIKWHNRTKKNLRSAFNASEDR